jgi:hypothetical protein
MTHTDLETSVRPAEDPMLPSPVRSRHLVRDSFLLDMAIDDYRAALDLTGTPERWNPFVVASIAGSGVVAVVAPTRLAGMLCLRGEVRQDSHRGDFQLAASGGVRRHGLQLEHEVTALKVGSFHTSFTIATKTRGIQSSLLSPRRIAEWHAEEFASMRSRASRAQAQLGV